MEEKRGLIGKADGRKVGRWQAIGACTVRPGENMIKNVNGLKKNKKRLQTGYGCIGLLLAAGLALCGCGSEFPALTDEQVEKAGEYAALTLLKYDSQNRKRLMSLEDMQAEEQRRQAWKQAAQQAAKEEQEEAKTSQEQSENGQVIDVPGGTTDYGRIGDGFTLPDGVELQYKGYQLCDVYPEDESDYFAIVAAEGKKNLLLRFLLTNGSEGSQQLDLASQKNSYRITVNDTYTRNSLPTFLANDLMNYQGRLMPGASEELVLLMEVESDVTVSSLKLRVKNDQIAYTILLEP